MIFDWFFRDHLKYGVFELRADGGYPGFDTWVKVAEGAGKGLKVGLFVDDVRDKTINQCGALGFAPGVNVVCRLANGFVAQSFSDGAGFQGIGQHDGRNVCRGWGKVYGGDASDTQSSEDFIGVVVDGFAEVVDGARNVINVAHGVKFFGG